MKKADFIQQLNWDRRSCTETLAKFKKDLDENPQYAFEWSLSSFEAAAKIRAIDLVLELFENGVEYSDIKERLTQETLRKARWPERSTSPVSNFASECKTAAVAEMLANEFSRDGLEA